jgi:hypothetical protein
MAVGNNGLLDGIRQIPARLRALDILGGLTGAPLGFRLRGATKSGPPSSGTWKAGDIVPDRQGTLWTCLAAGSPGQWASTSLVANIMTYGADPTGTVDSTAAIQAALLSFGTLGSWLQGQGGIAYVPRGQYLISKTLVVPSGVTFAGSGWGSQVTLAANSGCDMVQFATNDSASQATVLGVSASGIANAFYAGVRDLALHGDAFSATVPAYFHGVNVTTNPVSTAAVGDPGFDPLPTIENVWVKAVTGDAFFHENGRSGAFLKRVLADTCNGNAFSVGTDTTLVDCLAAFCSAGFYLNHSANVGTGCKAYNSYDWTWVSGASYVATELAVSGGALYWCILAVSGSTPPASDATHWTLLTAATAPQATGYGYYWDTNASEHCWSAVDAQDNSKGGYYFHGPLGGAVSVDGTSATDNFNNSQPAYNSANPNHYACVTFDGCSGVNMRLSSSKQTGNSVVICTLLNSPGSNTLIATTDGTEAAVFNGGTPAFALVNGQVQSALTATQSVTAGVVTLTFSSTLSVNAAAGNTFRVTMTGNTTISAPTNPVDSQKITFELIQDATGSRTVTWSSSAGGYDFGTAGAPVLTTTASKRDLAGFQYSSSLAKWMYLGISLGM